MDIPPVIATPSPLRNDVTVVVVVVQAEAPVDIPPVIATPSPLRNDVTVVVVVQAEALWIFRQLLPHLTTNK